MCWEGSGAGVFRSAGGEDYAVKVEQMCSVSRLCCKGSWDCRLCGGNGAGGAGCVVKVEVERLHYIGVLEVEQV